ncbi:hypothetical protein ACVW06_000001 [Pantoea ananatis]
MDDITKGKNIFFDLGIKELKKKVPHSITNNRRGISFIYFHDVFLKNYLNQDLINRKHKRIVIISTQRMMPLALYYYRHFWNVVAVIDAKSSLQKITEIIENVCFCGIRNVSDKECVGRLSSFEYNILKMRLDGFDATQVTKKLDINLKQYYQHSERLSKKMGVRKFHYLNISH